MAGERHMDVRVSGFTSERQRHAWLVPFKKERLPQQGEHMGIRVEGR